MPFDGMPEVVDAEVIETAAAGPTARDVAFGIGRAWIEHRAAQGVPVTGTDPLVKLRRLIEPALTAGYTDPEVRRALAAIGDAIPSRAQLDRRLALQRGVETPRANGRPTPADRQAANIATLRQAVADRQAPTGGGTLLAALRARTTEVAPRRALAAGGER